VHTQSQEEKGIQLGKKKKKKKKKKGNCLAKSFSLVLGCENVVVQTHILTNFLIQIAPINVTCTTPVQEGHIF